MIHTAFPVLAGVLCVCTMVCAGAPTEHVLVLRALDMLALSNACAASRYVDAVATTTTVIDGLSVACWRHLLQARCAFLNRQHDDVRSNCLAVLPALESSTAAAHRQRHYEVLCMLKHVAKQGGPHQHTLQELAAIRTAMERLREQARTMPSLQAKALFDCVQLRNLEEETQRLSFLKQRAYEELSHAEPTNWVAVARVVDAVCAWLDCHQEIARQRIALLEPVEPRMAELLPAQYRLLTEWLFRAGEYQRAFDAIATGAHILPAEDAMALYCDVWSHWIEHADSGEIARAVPACQSISIRRPFSPAWAPCVTRMRAFHVQPRLLFYQWLQHAVAHDDRAALLRVYSAQAFTDGSWKFFNDAITWLVDNSYTQHVPRLLMFTAAPDQRSKYPDIKTCWQTVTGVARGHADREASAAVTWYAACHHILVPEVQERQP